MNKNLNKVLNEIEKNEIVDLVVGPMTVCQAKLEIDRVFAFRDPEYLIVIMQKEDYAQPENKNKYHTRLYISKEDFYKHK